MAVTPLTSQFDRSMFKILPPPPIWSINIALKRGKGERHAVCETIIVAVNEVVDESEVGQLASCP